MPSIDTIMVTLINQIFPSTIQFIMVLTALMGTVVVLLAFMSIYKMISEDEMRTPEGATIGGSLVRVLIGGLMVVPAVVLWQAADALIAGGTVTQTSVMAYVAGTAPTTTCARFASAVQLMFLVVGLIAIYMAYRSADDQARGFNPNGYRIAVPYLLGGLGCFFIEDIMVILGNTFSLNVGFPQLCIALG